MLMIDMGWTWSDGMDLSQSLCERISILIVTRDTASLLGHFAKSFRKTLGKTSANNLCCFENRADQGSWRL